MKQYGQQPPPLPATSQPPPPPPKEDKPPLPPNVATAGSYNFNSTAPPVSLRNIQQIKKISFT